MRFSILAALAALSSTVLSQGLQSGLPKCAQDCFGNNVGSCSFADVACICKSSAITSIACCVLSTCNQADKDNTINLATALCKGSGVELNTNPTCPSSGSSASASASASASSSASASGSAGAASASSASASASSSASASRSAATAASTAAAPFQSAGAGLGLGVAMVGLLAAL